MKWTGAASLAVSTLQFARLIVLARLLSADDFGLMAMMTVVMGFAATFADTGFSNAIIFRQDVTREQLSSLYWTTWITGFGIWTLLIAATPLAALLYHEPRIQSLLPWAAATFLIAPAGQQFKVLLQRDLRFQEIAAIEIAAAVVGAFASIALAIAGYDVYALIFGQLLGNAVDSGLAAVIGWKNWPPQLHLKLRDLKDFAGFGAFQMGERSVNFFTANIDYLLIGRVLGPAALGSYSLAYQLVVAPLMRINPVLTRVAFPIFAKKQDDLPALRNGYLEISKFLAFVVSPLLIGIAAAAPVLVPVMLGSRWADAVPLVEILAPVGLLKTFGNPSGSVVLAKGRADLAFWVNLFIAVEYLVVFSAVVKAGTVALSIAYLIVIGINFVVGQEIINRLLGLNWRTYLQAIAGSVTSAFLMAAVVRLGWWFFEPRIGAGLPGAAMLVIAGGVVYGICVLFFQRTYTANILKLIRYGT